MSKYENSWRVGLEAATS